MLNIFCCLILCINLAIGNILLLDDFKIAPKKLQNKNRFVFTDLSVSEKFELRDAFVGVNVTF